MKKFYTLALLLLSFAAGYSQILTGGLHANFGVDADTKASYKKYGPSGDYSNSDDWFSLAGAKGKGVIDTTNAAYYKTQLQNGKNISFMQNMSVAPYSNVNGRLWLDAAYVRDHYYRDSTSFTAAINGVNPSQWTVGTRTLAADNDIIDAYAHLRRNGLSVNDSLWFFAGVSTVGRSEDRYVDIELYSKNLSYNKSTKKFTSGGIISGHTQWLFDLTGKVIQAGDVLITIVYRAGQQPKVDVHIWVSKLNTYLMNPSMFKFGSVFHASGSNASYGYANIVPKSTLTKTGSAIVNYSSVTTSDTTYAAPWGTVKSTGAWSQNYQSKQFAEIGLNLTRIGVDPSSYVATSNLSCTNFYQSVLFKSGYETNGTNPWDDDGHSCGDNNEYIDLEDFAGPINFTSPTLNYTIKKADTITCKNPVATLTVANQSMPGIFTWSTVDGEILNANSDNTSINVQKQGTYTLVSTLAVGCPTLRADQVTVKADLTPPVATGDIGMTENGELQLLGGDTALSNVITPFGGSQGVSWSWTGPNGFTASCQNPLIPGEWVWGSYYLTVTEKRNGCSASVPVDVSFRSTTPVSRQLTSENKGQGSYVARSSSGNKLMLVTNQSENNVARCAVYNVNGQLIASKNVQLINGQNSIELPVTSGNQVRIVSMFIGNKMVFTKKILF